MKLNAVLAVFILIFIIVSCSNDNTGPDNDQVKRYGWAVGNPIDGYGTIVHTRDEGESWLRQGDTLSIPNVMLHQIRALDSLRAWTVGGPSAGFGTILKTDDGGETWMRMGSLWDIPDTDISAISIIDDNNVWVSGGEGSILVTYDGGLNWEFRSDPLYGEYRMSDIVAVDVNNIWVCGGTTNSGIILHSVDGGLTWESEGDSTLTQNYPLIDLSIINSDRAWIAGHSTSLRTINGGDSWERKCPFDLVLFDVNGVCPLDENTVWLVSDYGNIHKSNDNGETWEQQVSNASNFYLLRICAFDNNNAWICGTEQFPPFNGIILHTTDGGENWLPVDYGSSGGLWDIDFVDSFQ